MELIYIIILLALLALMYRDVNGVPKANALEALRLYPIRSSLFIVSTIAFIFLQSYSIMGWPDLNLHQGMFSRLAALSTITMLFTYSSLIHKVI